MTDHPDDWRQGSIGGSDIAGILDISPWATPWSVWAETVGLSTGDNHDEVTRKRLDVGTDAEPFLKAQFERHHEGLTIAREQVRLTHPEYEWASGHADGMVCDGAEVIGGWEAKTDRAFTPWDEVPAYYQAQIQYYCWLANLPRWYVTVGFAGWRVEHYIVERNDDDIALMVARAEAFWRDHVLTGTPPPTDGHQATSAAISDAYPESAPDAEVEADDRLASIVAELDGVKRHIKADQRRRDALENELKAVLGDRSELVRDGASIASWRTQTTTRIDGPAVRAAHGDAFNRTATTRVFRTHLPD